MHTCKRLYLWVDWHTAAGGLTLIHFHLDHSLLGLFGIQLREMFLLNHHQFSAAEIQLLLISKKWLFPDYTYMYVAGHQSGDYNLIPVQNIVQQIWDHHDKLWAVLWQISLLGWDKHGRLVIVIFQLILRRNSSFWNCFS